ncbi:BLUF domain-containing protein [Rasiella sp. SM2506]|uniref:BLUF domain-containing protein n=1 Tax=Rasiella sp. SM2506 TaxID=3423914 RepID=UPI003D7A8916
MKSLHTICYISNAAPQLSELDVENIFSEASEQNNNANVSGILLYNLGHFFQVIEGEVKHILNLYENKIKNDVRHQDIFEVYNKATAKPLFFNYDSKFNVLKTEEDFRKIREYLSNVHTTTSNKLTRLLLPFVMYQKIDRS